MWYLQASEQPPEAPSNSGGADITETASYTADTFEIYLASRRLVTGGLLATALALGRALGHSGGRVGLRGVDSSI